MHQNPATYYAKEHSDTYRFIERYRCSQRIDNDNRLLIHNIKKARCMGSGPFHFYASDLLSAERFI